LFDDTLTALAAAKTITVHRGERVIAVKITPGERQAGQIGIEREAASVFRRETITGSLVPALEKTAQAAMLVYVIFRKLFSADLSRDVVAGPLGILQFTYMAAQRGWSDLFHLVGMITVNIGVINLFPLPPLDGGRLVLLAYEKIRGRAPRRKVQEVVIMAGFMLLLGVILLATFNDVTRMFF